MSDAKKGQAATGSGKIAPKTIAKKTAAKTNRGLGRGLSSLLGDSAVTAALGDQSPQAQPAPVSQSADSSSMTGTAVRNLPVEWINPGPWQPRRVFEQDGLQELAASMRQQGIVQPILVRPNPDKPSRYQIIAGERRWRAAQIAQLHEIPALIRDMSDKDASEIALIENIQRRDLHVIEEAQAYQTLLEMHGYTQQELSEIIGKSRPHITNLMRLLTLPEAVQMMVASSELTMGQVRPLIGHENAAQLARYIKEKSLSSRDAEKLAKFGIPQKSSTGGTSNKSSDIKALEDSAKRDLGLAMALDWKEDTERGTIKISVRSLDEFEDILKRLGLPL